MKYLILSAFTVLAALFSDAQKSIYDYGIETIDDKTLSLSDFKGSKILIAAASPQVLERSLGKYLDSLKLVFPSLKIVLIPSSDFGGSRNTEILENEKSMSKRGFVTAKLAATKKDKGAGQLPLCRWLNSSLLNSHFEADVASEQQFYVISESGVLYSIIENEATPDILTAILRQEDVKE